MKRWPALDIRLEAEAGTQAGALAGREAQADRAGLFAAWLDDFSPTAIAELDTSGEDTLAWRVFFASDEARTIAEAAVTASGELPEAEMATTSVPPSTNDGSSKPLCTTMGTGMNGPATAARRSPTQPAAPVPSTSTLAMSSCSGSEPVTVRPRDAATSWSGSPRIASRMPSESATAATARRGWRGRRPGPPWP